MLIAAPTAMCRAHAMTVAAMAAVRRPVAVLMSNAARARLSRIAPKVFEVKNLRATEAAALMGEQALTRRVLAGVNETVFIALLD